MLKVGLTGSMAMGKSTIANFFKELGIPVFDSDKAVHKLYKKQGMASIEIASQFPEVMTDGAVDRQKLSQLVQRDNSVLQKLEQIVHPMVQELEKQAIKDAAEKQQPYIIIDIPLLFETGRMPDFDKIIVVSTSTAIQEKRILTRPSMTRQKMQLILERQIPDSEKRQQADFIIDTSHTLDHTFQQVKQIASQLNVLAKIEERNA